MIGEPVALAADAFVVPGFWRPTGSPVGLQVSSLVLCGAEPVLVDTSLGLDGAEWLDTVCSLVDPAEVRWVIVTGAGPAHGGGLALVQQACPEATFVAPPPWASDSTLVAGDRVLELLAAPDGGAVHDKANGLLWADALATPLPGPTADVGALDDAFLADGLATDHAAQWAELLERLQPRTLGSVRGPIARSTAVDRAGALLARLGSNQEVQGFSASPPPPSLIDRLVLSVLANRTG